MTTVQVLEHLLVYGVLLESEQAAITEAIAWAKVGEWMKASPPYFPRRVSYSAMTKMYVAADSQDIFAEAPTITELAAKLEKIK